MRNLMLSVFATLVPCGLLLHPQKCRSAENSITGADTRPVRVALMNLVCEDNSYRSTSGALDFTTALQAAIVGDAGHQWVERAEMEKMEGELRLSAFGQTDRAEAVRGGKWLKADWSVFGRISTNNASGRQLDLEVVDLQHAEMLAATNVTLAPDTGTYFHAGFGDITLLNVVLRSLIAQADAVATQRREQTSVALIYFAPRGMVDHTSAVSDAELENAVLACATNGRPARFVQFSRPGEAMDEAGMTLSGFVGTDPNSWERVVDEYVWGTYSIRNDRHFDKPTRSWQDAVSVEIALNVWDGKTAPQAISLTITNDTSPQAMARQAAQAVAPALARKADGIAVEGVRQRVAASLLDRFNIMHAGDPNLGWGLDTPDGRQEWLEALRILETACFFDPANAAARERWLGLRWPAFPPFPYRNKFAYTRRRSEAWGKYVDQFGFKSALAGGKAGGIVSEYVLSAYEPFEMFGFAQDNQREWGIPADAGIREIAAWQKQLGSEFIRRWLGRAGQSQRFRQGWSAFSRRRNGSMMTT